MYENDYIIMFDENGQPYLAHAFGDRWKGFTSRAANSSVGKAFTNARNNLNARWQGSNAHKYVAKIENAFKDGSPRYFYSMDELKAFQREKQAERALNKAKKKGTAITTDYINYNKAKTEANKARERVKGNRQAAATAIKQYGSTKLSDIRAKANDTAKWIDEHDAGLSESIKLATKGKKLSDEERAALNSERLADQYRTKSNLKYLKRKVGDKVNNAAKWIDDHDAGISETAEYMLKRNKVEADERDRLHDEMTNTKLGRLVSNTANNARTVSDKVKNSAKEVAKFIDDNDAGMTEAIELIAKKNKLSDEEKAALRTQIAADRKVWSDRGNKAVNKVGNIKVKYPTKIEFSEKSISDIAKDTGVKFSNAQTAIYNEAATTYANAVKWFNEAPDEVKDWAYNTLYLPAARGYNNMLDTLHIDNVDRVEEEV